jgi:CxxC motif-containing protein (DUF1111 family)
MFLSLVPQTSEAWAADAGLETEISWQSVDGNTYRLEWSEPPGEGPWTEMGGSLAGIGSAQSAYEHSRSERVYRVVETVPGSDEVLVPTNSLAGGNPGFESGSSDWQLGSTHTISQTDPHTGASSLRSSITGGPVGAILAKTVSTVVPGKSYTLSFHARQVSFGPSYVQHYRLVWVASGGAETFGGWINFTGGTGTWAKVTAAPVTAPNTAASARIEWYFATGPVAGAVGEVFLDDIEFAYQTALPAIPDETRVIPSATRPVMRLGWPSIPGVAYRIEQSDSLSSPDWSPVATVVGSAGSTFRRLPLEGSRKFYRIVRPILSITPPSNPRIVPTGLQGTISVAWDGSTEPGLTGYRILYGTSADNLDRSADVGLVESATLSDLEPGQTYYIAVAGLSADGPGEAGTLVLEAQPEDAPALVPLYDAATLLQPDPVVETSTAKITRLADRARDRHAREGIGFLLTGGPALSAAYKYDHYLPFYWEQRVAQIEIIDEVAKGGDRVVFNFTTQAKLNPAEFRTFFNIGSPLSGYHNNQSDYLNAGVTLASTNASVRYPGETDYNYTATVAQKMPEYRPLQIGDRMEIELSQFLLNPRNGRNNYYGTTFLYVVGQGIVPWYAKDWEASTNKVVGVTSFDSFPLPEDAWLGGSTTLPYQYSNEPQSRFKQMAGNITPENGQPFMLGRRLHHTDFRTGAHSEQGNPVFAEQIGKVGPKFVAQSCVACHANNGRSLLPEVGATIDRAVVKVGAREDGAPHPVLGEQLQPYSTEGAPEAGVTLQGYTEIEGIYGDGTPYTLRKPDLQFDGVTPAFYSLRMASSLVGVGLLEAVPESTILALADPADTDGDGISGRANLVSDPENPSVLRLGRFGLKATQATVLHQIAYAFNRDMEVTSSIFPILDGETVARPPEVSDEELDVMNRYVALLGVGARRDLQDAEVLRGRQLFTTASCVACHTPELTTGSYHPLGELRNQTIRPYTDLLLHDMGPGLADNMVGEGASGSEWRTAPLWNIGLSAGVSGGEGYLHDGRARTIEEAILWHGGEAEQAKENFRNMPAADRSAVIKFIRSL